MSFFLKKEVQLKIFGIKVIIVAPGSISTPIWEALKTHSKDDAKDVLKSMIKLKSGRESEIELKRTSPGPKKHAFRVLGATMLTCSPHLEMLS